MTRTVVITSIYGGFDRLLDPPEQSVPVDQWVCVTDDPDLRSDVWDIVVSPEPSVPPRLAAKYAKMLPLQYIKGGLRRADRVVRFDGATYLRHGDSVAELLAAAGDAVLAQFEHPARSCIYTELEAAATQPKYAGQPLREQIEHYRAEGHPADWGLWETGVLVYNFGLAPELLLAFGLDWLHHLERWSLQDQLSEPVVLRRYGLRPAPLPGNYWDNPIVGRQEHLLDA
jgi:hypothetical protein